jgi:uncharacterized protein YggE
MTDDAHTLISVRGEAERVVAPDSAHASLTVSAVAPTKADASASVVDTLNRLITTLGELGGQALGLDSMRAPVTWSTDGLRSHEEWDHSDGRAQVVAHRASVEMVISVRDFDRLDKITRALTQQDEIDVHGVAWSVDDDNPEWARVRADAIHAALLKSRDYAVALGGELLRVEHVADGGLLGRESSGGSSGHRGRAIPASAQRGGGDEDGVSLDPVPQRITAVIEARVTATVGPLPA